jgi:hypothetical protein
VGDVDGGKAVTGVNAAKPETGTEAPEGAAGYCRYAAIARMSSGVTCVALPLPPR